MASASVEAWEIALGEAFTEEQQGGICEKLRQASKPRRIPDEEVSTRGHHDIAKRLKGANEERHPKQKQERPYIFPSRPKYSIS